MERIKDVLPENLWKTMVRKLGREEALRLVWTTIVGPKLAGQIALQQLRGRDMIVSVPDAQWTRSLRPLEAMILEAVNRFPGSWRAESIEFVVETPPGNSAATGASSYHHRRRAAADDWRRGRVPVGTTDDAPVLKTNENSEQEYKSRAEGAGK